MRAQGQQGRHVPQGERKATLGPIYYDMYIFGVRVMFPKVRERPILYMTCTYSVLFGVRVMFPKVRGRRERKTALRVTLWAMLCIRFKAHASV